MNNLDEIKKRLSYAENNNLFQAHYINDMKYLIENNKLYVESCSTLNKTAELKDQAIINVSVDLVKYMKLTFDPDEVEYKKLNVLIGEIMSIPGMGPPAEKTVVSNVE